MATYAEVLADLKTEFGKKIFLSPEDIAPLIDRTPAAQAAMRTRENFPIAYTKLGGAIVIKIYDLAKYIAEDTEEVKPEPSVGRGKTNTAAGSFVNRPKLSRPSLAKTLLAFGKQIEQQELQNRFMRQLFAELEGIEFKRKFKDKLPKRPPHGIRL